MLDAVHRRYIVGVRGTILLSGVLLAVVAAWAVKLDVRELVPGEGGFDLVGQFLGHALKPAWSYEDEVPPGTQPLLIKALVASWTTIQFAVAACTLAMVMGLVLGFLGSTSWWTDETTALSRGSIARMRHGLAAAVYGGTRIVIAMMRSVHELIWAVLFLAAIGFSHLTAVVALALPFAGTLAKVFSELVDEAPREPGKALQLIGASPLQAFVFGLLPQALPDMCSYSLYRFECALRSSAVLGFFGFPTLGYYFAASFENLHYREVWTYLYMLIALVLVVDRWSAAVRRRLVMS